MRKKTVRRIGLFLLAAFLFLAVSYLGLAEYYKNGFSYGTWMNGIYCTGKTVEEVNEELLKSCSYAGLTIYDGEGNAFRIEPEDVDYTFDFKEALQSYLGRQNSYLWIENLFAAKERSLQPVVSYDEELLWEVLQSMPAFRGKKPEERTVSIQKTDAGYVLVDERKHVLNEEKAKERIAEKLLFLETTFDLEESGCYEDLPYTDAMNKELALWEKISQFQDCRIVYAFGEELVPIDASIVCDWMAVDEKGEFLYDEAGNIMQDNEKIEAFIDELAAEFDTVGAVRHFNATRGETVVIEGGTYGNRMDSKAEKEYLKLAFARKSEEIHTPQYIQMGWEQGRDDIGSTYIEVDMAKQMMYYYLDGKLELETPIVTGNTRRRWGTPEGVNYVYGKARNRILRGQGYESHVNFWMPVKGNIGIHDAAWRSEYGGEIYKTGGSHGCINTPYEAMNRLYDMAEIGTPVVMFY